MEVMTDAPAPDSILTVRDLKTWFVSRRFTAKAVDGVTFDLKRGETLAVVGESGSGKSVTSLSIMGLLSRPGRIEGGEILFRNRAGTIRDLATFGPGDFRKIRGREIAMIFEQPTTSHNPLYTVGDQIGEMIALHEKVGREENRKRAHA
jgi:peptide/nickel transport system ATP-binding protein